MCNWMDSSLDLLESIPREMILCGETAADRRTVCPSSVPSQPMQRHGREPTSGSNPFVTTTHQKVRRHFLLLLRLTISSSI